MTPWRAICLEHDRVLGTGSLEEVGTQELNHHIVTGGDCRSLREQIPAADVDQAADQVVVPDGGQIEACPRCDTSDFYRREPQKRSTTTSDAPRYRCRNGHEFDTPEQRDPKVTGGDSVSGAARALVEADPDDLATDGGPGHD